jgi:uncharacterized protein YjbI with pentapeptide repeats
MATQPAPTSTDLFDCECELDVRSSCAKEPFYGDFEGKRYCVLHFPGKEKRAAFSEALKRKVDAKDFNFAGVWFPEEVKFPHALFKTKVDFFKATFDAPVNFRSATFKGAVNFRESTFMAEAYFDHATFNAPAVFSQAKFLSNASFYKASFKKDAQAYFAGAAFRSESEADFREATFDSLAEFGSVRFKLANFSKASFNDESVFTDAHFDDEVSFSRASFVKEAAFGNARFESYANFSFTAFEKGDFPNARFRARANFSSTTFEEAEFRHAVFGDRDKAEFKQAFFGTKASFSYTRFGAEAIFTSATFRTQAYFSQVAFSGKADFSYAFFEDFAKFSGDKNKSGSEGKPPLDFQHARIAKPDHVSFVALTLHPHWFVHVDIRKLDFTDVGWESSISREIEELEKKEVSSPHLLLAIIYRQLAVNAEDNHRYEEASKFRYWAMELQRNVRWRDFAFWEGLRKRVSNRLQLFSRQRFLTPFRRDWLYWLYWAASGYGERIRRGFCVLIGVWLLFAWLYTQVGFIQPESNPVSGSVAANGVEAGKPLGLNQALIYSLGVMSLQKPDPRPLTNSAHTLVALQTISGPLQAALLALALRRKFMR